jgi:hypothetical protein
MECAKERELNLFIGTHTMLVAHHSKWVEQTVVQIRCESKSDALHPIKQIRDKRKEGLCKHSFILHCMHIV